MSPDDEICLCYHVTLRKLVHFARRTRPRHPAQMSDCLGAGTGCGWCIPFLTRIAGDPNEMLASLGKVEAHQYAAGRETYRCGPRRNRFDGQAPAQPGDSRGESPAQD